MISAHQEDIIGVQQLLANQDEVELTPMNAGRKKTLDRPVTAAFAGPARQTSHGHTTAHRQHRLDHPTQLA